MAKYSHRERLQMILAGEKPDRFAASFWRHFFHKEHDVHSTAEIMLAFQKEFDWDFMKINPRADYHTQDWGVKLEYSRNEYRKHNKSNFPVKDPEDWLKIKAHDPISPVLAEHLKMVALIRKNADRELPLLMTVFTPLAIAGRLVEDPRVLVEHICTAPEMVEKALRAISDTFKPFIAELRNAGADGIFYATLQWASADMLTWKEYERFGLPYDLEVISASENDALNLLHVCHSRNYLEHLHQHHYPCRIYNWDSLHETNLSLEAAYDNIKGKVFVGGVEENGWLQLDRDTVRDKISRLLKLHDPHRLIIGPGCCIPPETPFENLKIIREKING
ncbi:MAG: uroporphyrinogen decarboxylase family protein [candidate division Zixibacteria bacterium]|nr:uroporphyrinogen decarboxylase family protein [candidate division Zixibacteria bacterium]MDD5425977.1 uroporphyrinogen decarboxylase family protein [candidate division Zixibacteria bacterium]